MLKKGITIRSNELISLEVIEHRIFLIRGQKVILSLHIADMYGVEHKVLMQAVKRNRDRFPNDFMFQLSKEEFENLKSQIVTSRWGGLRKHPYAFTEQGVAMLSSVLRSKRAIHVNVAIMRAFVKLREILGTHKDQAHKLEELERKLGTHDRQIQSIFEAISQLMAPPEKPKRQIGFLVEEPKTIYRTKRRKG